MALAPLLIHLSLVLGAMDVGFRNKAAYELLPFFRQTPDIIPKPKMRVVERRVASIRYSDKIHVGVFLLETFVPVHMWGSDKKLIRYVELYGLLPAIADRYFYLLVSQKRGKEFLAGQSFMLSDFKGYAACDC
jgi:hypothetical protein